MKHLTFPIALDHTEVVISFHADHPELALLGEPGFIENDTDRTAGGRELFWAYELEDGLRLQLAFHELYESVAVTVDPPDVERGQAALRKLGLTMDLKVHPPASTERESKREPSGLVWVFTGEGSKLPTGIFASRQDAERHIGKKGYSGVLVPYPLNRFLFDVYRSFNPPAAAQLAPEQAQAYTGDFDDQTDFFRGQRVPHGAIWQVWRKDAQGGSSAISSHATRAEAETARALIERAVPDRNHWVEPAPPQAASATPG